MEEVKIYTTSWDIWVEEAVSKLESLKLLRSLRPISTLNNNNNNYPPTNDLNLIKQQQENELETFDSLRPSDRSSVQVHISQSTFRQWFHNLPTSGDEIIHRAGDLNVKLKDCPQLSKKLLLFSGNDYLGLGSHPAVRKAASKAALEHGMGPRGSALICGYTDHHSLLESCLADLKKKEVIASFYYGSMNGSLLKYTQNYTG